MIAPPLPAIYILWQGSVRFDFGYGWPARNAGGLRSGYRTLIARLRDAAVAGTNGRGVDSGGIGRVGRAEPADDQRPGAQGQPDGPRANRQVPRHSAQPDGIRPYRIPGGSARSQGSGRCQYGLLST